MVLFEFNDLSQDNWRLRFSLENTKKIQYPWHVCLSLSESNLETGFSLVPDIKYVENPCLQAMQEDTQVIAMNLVTGLRNIALEYVEQYEQQVKIE